LCIVVQNGVTVVLTSSKWCYSGAHQFKILDRDLLKEIKNKSYHEKKNETFKTKTQAINKN
jgi:hypothetical protein